MKNRFQLVKSFVVFVAILAALCDCSSGKRSLLIMETCVNNDQGVADFMRAIRAIAASEQLTFVEGGAQTQQELITVGAKFQKLETPGSVLNFGLNSGDDPIIMGSNLGLPQYQIAIGFSGTADSKKMLRLAEIVRKQLTAHWKVQNVPDGTGATPMPSCPGKV